MTRAPCYVACALASLSACQFYYDEPPLECDGLVAGAQINGNNGGSQASQTELQAAMDYAAVAASSMLKLTTRCGFIAERLGVDSAALDDAFARPVQDDQMTAVCTLASDAIARARGADAVTLNAAVPACVVSAELSGVCQRGCVPASDDCTAACDAAARAKAECPEPVVAPSGASSAELGLVLAEHFGEVLALRARVALLAEDGAPLASTAATIHDIRGMCRPLVPKRVESARRHVAATREAIDALVAAAGG